MVESDSGVGSPDAGRRTASPLTVSPSHQCSVRRARSASGSAPESERRGAYCIRLDLRLAYYAPPRRDAPRLPYARHASRDGRPDAPIRSIGGTLCGVLSYWVHWAIPTAHEHTNPSRRITRAQHPHTHATTTQGHHVDALFQHHCTGGHKSHQGSIDRWVPAIRDSFITVDRAPPP
jgi:hypothetical protein